MNPDIKIAGALAVAFDYGQIDGAHHKAWVIDQMVRKLLGSDEAYQEWVATYCGDDEYEWDTGVAP